MKVNRNRLAILPIAILIAACNGPAVLSATSSPMPDASTPAVINPPSPTAVVTITPSVQPSATTAYPTKTPSALPSPAASATKMAASAYANLTPGQYLIYENGSTVYAFSLAIGGSRFLPVNLPDLATPPDLSPDGKILSYHYGDADYFVDMLSGAVIAELPANGCDWPSIEPGNLRFVVVCNGNLAIEDASRQSPKTILLALDSAQGVESHGWAFPQWSPDGKWIAFFDVVPDRSGPHIALYLLDTTCLAAVASCKSKTRGPFDVGMGSFYFRKLVWSADSRFLASWLSIFDSELNMNEELLPIPTSDMENVSDLAISPDGMSVAVGIGNSTLIFANDHAQFRRVRQIDLDGGVLAWIAVP